MAVQTFVRRRPDRTPWPPDHEHETGAICGIIQRLWAAFNHERGLYAALVNLDRPSADLVIINERGIGVIELKHSEGKITSDGSVWYNNGKQINAGTRSDINNPREQVLAYAGTLRSILAPQLAKWWGISESDAFHQLNVQTAVCFTNSAVQFDEAKPSLEKEAQLARRRWSVFSILKPAEIPEWALRLSFGMKRGREASFAPYTLTPAQMLELAIHTFPLTEWTEIRELMPDGKPYGYLLLMDEGQVVRHYPLKVVETTIGRDSSRCDIEIPETYSKASRQHAQLIRIASHIFIKDLGSSRGTFVDGQRITELTLLRTGQRLTFGGPEAGAGVCELRFTTTLPKELASDSTVIITAGNKNVQ